MNLHVLQGLSDIYILARGAVVVLKNEIPSCHHDLRHRMRE